MTNGEISFDFELTKENEKALKELLNAKGLVHYMIETKEKEKLDLVEYKDYQELEQQLQKYKNIVDTILEYGIYMDECPLNFSFDENSIQDKAQNIFYSDNGKFCENNCNDCYKKCWLKFFKEMQRLKEIK